MPLVLYLPSSTRFWQPGKAFPQRKLYSYRSVKKNGYKSAIGLFLPLLGTELLCIHSSWEGAGWSSKKGTHIIRWGFQMNDYVPDINPMWHANGFMGPTEFLHPNSVRTHIQYVCRDRSVRSIIWQWCAYGGGGRDTRVSRMCRFTAGCRRWLSGRSNLDAWIAEMTVDVTSGSGDCL